MDDERLIAAVAAGDDGALRTLFERHAPWLAGRLRRALPASAVEDVLQETFIAVWRGARTYRPAGKPGAWIWGIARRQAATWARRNARPDLALDDLPARDDLAETATRRTDLQRALADLGPVGHERRELARLALLEDRPLADIAVRLGIPIGTVKSRLHHLRRRLQEKLR